MRFVATRKPNQNHYHNQNSFQNLAKIAARTPNKNAAQNFLHNQLHF